MPFWSRDEEKRMEDSKEGNKEVEKIVIDEDSAFLKSMMMDRAASYCSQDKITPKLEGYYKPLDAPRRSQMPLDAPRRSQRPLDAPGGL